MATIFCRLIFVILMLDGLASALFGNGANRRRFEVNPYCVSWHTEPECSSDFPMWRYDAETNSCVDYKGCYAGSNKFRSLDDCTKVCVDPTSPPGVKRSKNINVSPATSTPTNKDSDEETTIESSSLSPTTDGTTLEPATDVDVLVITQAPADNTSCISVPEESKMCLFPTSLWRYDEKEGSCLKFQGCLGGSNKFSSYDACMETCAGSGVTTTTAEIPTSTLKTSTFLNLKDPNWSLKTTPRLRTPIESQPLYCRLGVDVGECKPENWKRRFYFDNSEQICREFVFYQGRCESSKNLNIFETLKDCHLKCETLPAMLRNAYCLLSPDNGTRCLPAVQGQNNQQTRYYFSETSGTCKTFNFIGCSPGNENNFASEEACTDTCIFGNDEKIKKMLLSSDDGDEGTSTTMETTSTTDEPGEQDNGESHEIKAGDEKSST